MSRWNVKQLLDLIAVPVHGSENRLLFRSAVDHDNCAFALRLVADVDFIAMPAEVLNRRVEFSVRCLESYLTVAVEAAKRHETELLGRRSNQLAFVLL